MTRVFLGFGEMGFGEMGHNRPISLPLHLCLFPRHYH